MRLVLVIIVVFWWVARVEAATYTAATPNVSDVQAKINLTVNGDTVLVPSGIATWTTNAFLTNTINLIGAGIGSTIITDAVPRINGRDSEGIYWTLLPTGGGSLNGFEFRGTNGQSNPNTGFAEIQGNNFAFRICSNLFNVNNRAIQLHGWVYGCEDHCTNILNFTQGIEYWDDAYGGGQFGDLSWLDPDFQGSTNCFCIETCSFYEQTMSQAGAIDSMGGGRIVVRYNVFTNCSSSTHGTETTGRQRSVRWVEDYGNQQYQQASGYSSSVGQLRGGTGVFHDNNLFGRDYQFYKQLSYYREIYSFAQWETANGTNGWDLNYSTIFASGGHAGTNGSPVLVAPGPVFVPGLYVGTNIIWNVTQGWAALVVANDTTTITPSQLGQSVTGGGPPLTFNHNDQWQMRAVQAGIDQPGRGQQATPFTANSVPAQPQTWMGEALDPVYAWQIRINGALIGIGSGYPSVLEGRDFFNTSKVGYTPLVYPHPLVAGGVPGPPTLLPVVNVNLTGNARISGNAVIR